MTHAIVRELDRLAQSQPDFAPVRLGRIMSCDGGLIEVGGLNAPIGTLCRAETQAGAQAAEVVGFRGGRSLMMLLGDTVRQAV